MTVATEFDVGPLTWVKSEIDLALERAVQALQQFTASVAAGNADLTQIKYCRTHLHQVQGALTIVGLDGVTQFAEAVESLLESVEQQTQRADEALISLAQRALAAIAHYLDDLTIGLPNQPLRLLSLYREIQAARGEQRFSATDLFFPDLSARPPRRAAPAQISRGEFQRIVRQERARFQRGFLSWLRTPQDRSGISEMLAAVKRIEDTQDAPASRSFWWVATGFLSALAEGTLPAETNIKQLCARIDLQIRRLLEGSKNVAERLMRDALFFVASADSNNNAVQQVKQTYHLDAVIPVTETLAPAPEETVRRKLRDIISATEETWNKYCAGTQQSLHQFKEHAHTLASVVEQLGHTDYRRLAQAIASAANWLAEDTSRHSEALAMEIATAILLTLNAQSNFQRLGSDFAHQVDVTVARIHGCLAGTPPQPGSEIPLLDEMSRQAQEKLLIGHVAKEIQSNLAHIEQVLDGFFRDADKRADLDALETPLRQVSGALSMMRHDEAVVALRQCAAEIKHFSSPDYVPLESDFEHVATQLSVIGFFIDALPNGVDDFSTFVRQMQAGPSGGASSSGQDESALSVEQEVEQQKLETHALLGALMEQPEDSGLREELKQNLVALKNDADLMADNALGEQTSAMLSALETGQSAAPHIEQAMASLRPQGADAPQPSAETLQLSQASSEEIDAELLEIFLEEANEVLGTFAASLKGLKDQPHNVELLTTIRRAFHTLKGSGRMVGLKDVGETAWAVEQTLNLWLRQELVVAAPLFDLLDHTAKVFSAWVHHLETHAGDAPDPRMLVAQAEALRAVNEEQRDPLALLEPRIPEHTSTTLNPVTDSAQPGEIITDEPERHSAEIITLDFPGKHPHPEEEQEASGLDVIELADSGFSPAQHIDIIAETAENSSATAQEPQQRIVISPVLYEIFSEEAANHLATLQRELPILERNELLATPHEMYRAAHTLAGISATVGLTSINRLGLALEHALLRREHSATPGSLEALGVIRQAVGEIELMLAMLAEQRDPGEPNALIETLDSLYPASFNLAHDDTAEAHQPEETAALSSEPETIGTEQFDAQSGASFVAVVPQLQDEIDEQLLPIFLEEALDLNQGITAQLRAWRNAPESSEAVRTLTRLLHTLKGSARMAGAMNLGELTHAIETRVDQAIRNGNVSVDTIDEIDNSFDTVLHLVDNLHHGDTSEHAAPAPDEGAQAAAAASAGEAVVVLAERRGDRQRLNEGDAEGDLEPGTQRATVRVRADLIDRLVNEAGELSIARARIEGEMRSLKESLLDLTENVIRLRRQLREIEIQAETQMQSRTAQTEELHAGFDPLEFDRFTRFQELTRMMAESVNDVATVQQNLLKNLDDANAAIIAQARLNREVQQELMSVRMVPFGSLADRLYRIARQTSKELNKRANLEIRGSQVELDRTVLDKIAAPLEHMLRNAIAHGLEEREERLARGKRDIGEISLSLKQEGNEIILSFSDDGAGLDFDRIRERAIEAGLITADEKTEPGQLADLIFTPGFTTASSISQVSGRGIGMDVVKTEVNSLGGRIEILSTPGQGTEFRLYIPLTLAVTKALLVRAGNRMYAIPSVMIEQVLDLKEAALTRIRDAGSAEWMGNHYPFNYLPHLLGDTQALPEQHRQYWTLLLRSGTRRISVQVDELKGNEEIVVKNIGPQLARVIGVDGATVLGNGQVVLILNPVALSSRIPVSEFITPIPTAPTLHGEEAVTASLPTIMVVDDSLTVRKITGRLLAREGYQVLTAKDGVEALEQLLDIVPDVILVDIEMPRMDGFDLTRNIRADALLKNIPIIMITSRTADKHRDYAFEIGVNQYLGKPYEEEELLHLVADYVRQQRG